MDVEKRIFPIIQLIIFVIIVIFALVYSISIICIRRFHQLNNILTLNICLASIFCCLSWLPIYILVFMKRSNEISANVLIFLNLAQNIFTLEVPLSFVITSVHRYCSIAYHTKAFFRKRRWIIICIGSQWIFGFILAIPIFICTFAPCDRSIWLAVYVFVTTVVISSIMCLIINMFIYHYVRSSSRRVQPQDASGNIQQIKINHRDIYLLKHMVIMFCIFVGGWAPVFIIPIIEHYTPVDQVINSISTILCELASLIDIVDLFLYNHQLRKYFKDLLRC
ncbi:hypothetical protein I4U23_024770 [Adineta vaga]|nr:hypothetical protein I4U23_024770 [Adineta vaga]